MVDFSVSALGLAFHERTASTGLLIFNIIICMTIRISSEIHIEINIINVDIGIGINVSGSNRIYIYANVN